MINEAGVKIAVDLYARRRLLKSNINRSHGLNLYDISGVTSYVASVAGAGNARKICDAMGEVIKAEMEKELATVEMALQNLGCDISD